MRNSIKTIIYTALCVALFQLSACKGKNKESNTTSQSVTVDTAAHGNIPVVIAGNDELVKNVKDATKDFPTVTAKVDSSMITLTGSISRKDLPQLMMNLNALHPKKINNNLTIEN